MKYFYSFLLLLIINLVQGLRSDNYCKKIDKKIECEMYSCGKYFCSNNKNDCDYIISMGNSMKKYNKQDRRLKNYKNFINSIINCESNGHIEFKNQWTHRFNFGWKEQYRICIETVPLN